MQVLAVRMRHNNSICTSAQRTLPSARIFSSATAWSAGKSFNSTPPVPPPNCPPREAWPVLLPLSRRPPLVEDKLEDVHVNPNDPTKVALADQTDGVYEVDFSLSFNVDGTLNTGTSSFVVSLLETVNDNDDDPVSGTNLRNPDNLVWSSDGFIYVNEDGSGNDVWKLDATTSMATLIADGHTTETSGVTDISSLVGFTPGSILLTNSYDGNSLNGNNGAVYMLVSPSAVLVPEPSTVGLGVVGILLLGALGWRYRKSARRGH